jgi:hypothetical protein
MNTSSSIADPVEGNEDRRMVQRIGWFGRQEFVLLEDKLLCRVKRIGVATEFSVPLMEVDPDPVRLRRRPWVLYVTSALLIAGMLWGIYTEINATRNNRGLGGTLAGVLGFFALICVWNCITNTIDVFVFRTSKGNIVLPARSPTTEKCSAFRRLLHDEVTQARSIEQRLTRAPLNALHADGFLDQWQFKKAIEQYCRRRE